MHPYRYISLRKPQATGFFPGGSRNSRVQAGSDFALSRFWIFPLNRLLNCGLALSEATRPMKQRIGSDVVAMGLDGP